MSRVVLDASTEGDGRTRPDSPYACSDDDTVGADDPPRVVEGGIAKGETLISCFVIVRGASLGQPHALVLVGRSGGHTTRLDLMQSSLVQVSSSFCPFHR